MAQSPSFYVSWTLFNMIKHCNCLIIYNQRSFGGSIQGGITRWTAVVKFNFAFYFLCVCVCFKWIGSNRRASTGSRSALTTLLLQVVIVWCITVMIVEEERIHVMEGLSFGRGWWGWDSQHAVLCCSFTPLLWGATAVTSLLGARVTTCWVFQRQLPLEQKPRDPTSIVAPPQNSWRIRKKTTPTSDDCIIILWMQSLLQQHFCFSFPFLSCLFLFFPLLECLLIKHFH